MIYIFLFIFLRNPPKSSGAPKKATAPSGVDEKTKKSSDSDSDSDDDDVIGKFVVIQKEE